IRLSDGLPQPSTGFYFGGGEWFAVTRPAQPTGRAGNIIGASNVAGSDIQISTAEPHNLGSAGQIVTVTLAHLRGNVAANGTHRVEILGNSLFRLVGVKPTGDFDPTVRGAIFYEAMEMDFRSKSNRLISGNRVTANLGEGLEVIVTPGIVFNANVIRNRFAANAGLGMEVLALSGGVGIKLGSDLQDVFGNSLDRNVFDRNTGAGLAIILNDSAIGSYDVRGNQFLGTLDDEDGDTPYQGDGMYVSLEGTNPGVAATSILSNSIVVGNSFGVDNLGNEGRGLFLRMQEDTLVDVVQVSNNQFVGNGKDQGSIRARLGEDINATAVNFSLVSNFSLPNRTPFVITIGTERMLVNSVDGNRVTVIRGFDNTIAVPHALGDFIVADNDNRDGDGFHFFRRDDSELRQLKVEKNTFSNNAGDGFELYMQNTGFAGVVGTDRLDLATFNENVLTNNGQFGLRIQALTDVRMEFTEFSNNVIDFNGSRGKDGSVLDGSHPAANNTAGGIGVFGLQQVEVHFPLHQNQVTNNIGDGVFFGFFSGAPSAFDVLTTRGVWSANDFSNNTRFGVRRDIGGFDKFTWVNNKFNDNGVSSLVRGTPTTPGGISATDTQIVIANGRLFPAGGFDVRVDGEEMTVTNITVDSITSVAVLTVIRGANATYAAPHNLNSILFPLTGGGARVIGAEDTDILAISNEFLRNAGDGLRLGQGTKAVLGDGTIDGRNFFDNNLRDGLKITDGTSATMADLNQSRSVSAVANTFVGNGDDGVDFEAADTHLTLHHSAFFRNRADGVEFRNIGSALPSSLDIRDSRFSFNGFEPDASKLAQLWGGRGIDVLQAGSGLTRVTILNNEVESNSQEGIYVVNSASNDQPQFLSSDTLSQTGSVAATPTIELRLRENVIKSNGNAAVIPAISTNVAQPDTQTRFSPGATGVGSVDGNPVVAPDPTRPGTLGGLVIRVGTADSDGGIGTFGGGGVTPASLNLGDIPATQLTGSKVKAEVLDNEFDGNFGAEVYFDAFTSTVRPQTTWIAFNVGDSPNA
ncbi:MAG: right-handed parallel beta-helix repeat-containing protein, partial [Planctomycetota bacterium]|nr:right-handed parallel beta-helix repeat-containing protein [Planctomycetota bacterium]